MKRGSSRQPGYDCRKECKHDPPGEHGISGGTWNYWVTDGKRAVLLHVLAHEYPDTVGPPEPAVKEIMEKPMAVLGFHDADPNGGHCDLVEGGKCRSDCTYNGGCDFWATHGDRTRFEQPESFWLALEAKLTGERPLLFGHMMDIIGNAIGATS